MLAGAASLPSLDRLLAVAEQYPDLKLSSNFDRLMKALIEVEKDLAVERIRYNDMANIYSTNLAKFPINVYAWIFGFETQPYFEATEEAQSFKPIDY
jgi:LemA protein